MKKSNLLIITLTALLTLNHAGVRNSCSAKDETFDISTLGIRGDVNGDETLSVLDLVRYRQYLLGKDVLLSSDYKADVNSDGQKNICDFITLKSALLGNTKIWSPKNMPVMDGSTSAIPLEAGFKSRMLGISYPDAKSIVKHHKTHESFQLLLSGVNDMIFTVPLSESQRNDAQQEGVQLNLTPVAREGFVFVVNKNNPVDSLTQQQIQDIYSGKITNWSQVGGNDEEIIAYQRNTDSGSQNYMIEFMKDSKLIDAPKDYMLVSMGGLMDAIAVYDNAQNAIGYSVYSYAAQMYENSSDVKFIAVDGVKPSRETMADSTYPLLSNTYILYTDNASQNTLDFIDWAVSDEGQQCVLENGYVPISDIEYPERLKLYNCKGTGKEKPADYKPSVKYSAFSRELDSYHYDNSEYRIDFLKDEDFQNVINDDLSKELKKFNNPNVNIQAVNGYMSITLTETEHRTYTGYGITKSAWENFSSLSYDLINKKKIEKFSDLFYKDSNFISLINKEIASEINLLPADYIRTDFLGITGSIDNFTISSLYFEDENPYLTKNFDLTYSSYYLPDYMITGEYYDMQTLFKNESLCSDVSYSQWNTITYKDNDGEYRQTIDGSRFHSDLEIEERKKAYDKVFNAGKAIRNKEEWSRNDRIIITATEPYDGFSTLNVLYVNISKIDGNLGPDMFDPYTGEQIFISDIFGKEFSDYDHAEYCYIGGIDLESKKVTLFNINNESIVLDLDPDHINMKYIFPMPHTLELTELEKPRTGQINHSYNLYGYASSYVLEYGPEKKQWPIEGNWSVTAKRKCYSHGKWWYECWDTDDNDYYGWISGVRIDFYD